jgi:hypothetical protein
MIVPLDVVVDLGGLDKWEIMTEREKAGALRGVGGRYLQLQTENINRGVDMHGRPFKAYSPGYAELKARAGRLGKNYWLRLTGQLLRSQVVKIVREAGALVAVIAFEGMHAAARFSTPRPGSRPAKAGGLTVNVTSREQTSNALLAAVNDMTRPFVGVSPQMLDKLVRTFKGALRRARGK